MAAVNQFTCNTVNEFIDAVTAFAAGRPITNAETAKMVIVRFIHDNHLVDIINVKKFDYGNHQLLLLYADNKMREMNHLARVCGNTVLCVPPEQVGIKIIVPISDYKPVISSINFEQLPIHTNDGVVFEAFEGVDVKVFFYVDTWYFCTTGCPSMDDSWFNSRDFTVGTMFDEAAARVLGIPADVFDRQHFGSFLDPHYVYIFTVVHHRNRRFTDYALRWGQNYAKLVLTKKYFQGIEIIDELVLHPEIGKGLEIPTKFDSVSEAIMCLNGLHPSNHDVPHALHYTSDHGGYTILTDLVCRRGKYDSGHPNEVMNIINLLRDESVSKPTPYEFFRDFRPQLNITQAECQNLQNHIEAVQYTMALYMYKNLYKAMNPKSPKLYKYYMNAFWTANLTQHQILASIKALPANKQRTLVHHFARSARKPNVHDQRIIDLEAMLPVYIVV